MSAPPARGGDAIQGFRGSEGRVENSKPGEVAPEKARVPCQKAVRPQTRVSRDEEVRDETGSWPAFLAIPTPGFACDCGAFGIESIEVDAQGREGLIELFLSWKVSADLRPNHIAGYEEPSIIARRNASCEVR